MRVTVIGAGIIGTLIAYRLAQGGAQVTVLEAGQAPGRGATGASFGWINASFYHDADHFRLRQRGLESWRALGQEVSLTALTWHGALSWESSGPDMDKAAQDLSAHGYPVDILEEPEISARVPCLRDVPERALAFMQEGIAEPQAATAHIMQAAQQLGAKFCFGVRATDLSSNGCVSTSAGPVPSDKIVVATGTGTEALMQAAGYVLPMLHRPGCVLRSQSLAPCLDTVLVTPAGEIRQDGAGRLIVPGAVAHQTDDGQNTPDTLDRLCRDVAARVEALLTLPERIRWVEVAHANRPVPGDGLPVIGAIGPDYYVAVMHSGVTLAALTAELVSAEILDKTSDAAELLAPYRPARFT